MKHAAKCSTMINPVPNGSVQIRKKRSGLYKLFYDVSQSTNVQKQSYIVNRLVNQIPYLYPKKTEKWRMNKKQVIKIIFQYIIHEAEYTKFW